jgi:acetylornithine deacetylase/succinyl-diaminopimelate desuccinylase-like protein
MDKETLEAAFEAGQDRMIEKWKEFLSFPSISADAAHASDCVNCATWLCDHLATIGVQSRLLETATKPVVFGELPGAADAPTVLFYGHYDVQPVDPPEAWVSPPFEPEWRDNRMYARGAQDNKGQVFYVIMALEALIASGVELPNIKIFIEGEEECGSDSLAAQLEEWKDLIAADVLMVCDTGTQIPGTGCITMGLRGIVHFTATLTGSKYDLHSGVHGGKAPNPAVAMARLIATLHDDEGHVLVDGFYDGVVEPTAEERRLANEVPFDAAAYESETGVEPAGGELAFTPAERIGFRPCLDLNGIHSGYGGAGGKTIIPSVATAKISARLVAGQDLGAVLESIVKHLQRHAPPALHLDISDQAVGGPGLRLDIDSPILQKAKTILRELTGKDALLYWEGASIPIVASLQRVSGGEPLLVGFGHEEDNIHAPNESFSIEQFRSGFIYVGMLLSSF